MHVLVAGWFSYEEMGNTAGDMIARDMVCHWLDEADVSYDVALATPFANGLCVNLETVDAAKYTDLVFVCGPFGNGWPVADLLARFNHCRLIGLNLTLLEPLSVWNPFNLLWARDSTTTTHPDITFHAPPPKTPVVGVIKISKQDEYGKRDFHRRAHEAIDRLVASREMSVVEIDTCLENNLGGLRTPGEIESLLARMDVVITTRLHGTVLALKNSVPVIPIDPVQGGAKVTHQVNAIGWPLLFQSDDLNDEQLADAFGFCLTEEARGKARECATRARVKVDIIRHEFIQGMKRHAQDMIDA